MKTCSSCGGKAFNPKSGSSRQRHRADHPQCQLAMKRDCGRPQLDLTAEEKREHQLKKQRAR